MRFDLYADLAALKACPADGSLPQGLAAGFVDGCTSWSTRGNNEKNDARRCYMQRASRAMLQLKEFKQLKLDADVGNLPDPSWIAFEIAFTLETPWYSKDDRPFHVLDNPVRKDRVFGVPYMSAASWKGLLRWTCRMHAGLRGYLQKHGGTLEGWKEPPWILHLFGNEREEKKDFQRGALAFCPTWFSKLGFEVINPHSRKRRAGSQPIYYEVVPADTEGSLRLLYAPLLGAGERDQINRKEAVEKLLDAVEALLTTYGISAKRTVGWGTAEIKSWTGTWRSTKTKPETRLANFKQKISAWLNSSGGAT
jgi:CRISPR-associated protein Cmr2